MANQPPATNKMMTSNAPSLREYFFAGSSEFPPITITASSMEDAQKQYAELKKKSTEPLKPAAKQEVE